MEIVEIEISSVEELETTIRALGHGARVLVSGVGAENLFEAAVIYRRLRILVESSEGSWEVDPETMQKLRRAAEHYEALDLLELHLDLVDLDLQLGITMKGVRFQGVRVAANDVVTSSHPTTALSILDRITIEAQRLARVAKGLGFGALDIHLPELTEEDIEWIAVEDISAHKLEALHLDDDDGDAGLGFGAPDIHLPELTEEDIEWMEVEDVGAHKLEALHLDDDDGDAVEVPLKDGLAALKLEDDGASLNTKAYRDWFLTKEEHVAAVLELKLSKLRSIIAESKLRPLL